MLHIHLQREIQKSGNDYIRRSCDVFIKTSFIWFHINCTEKSHCKIQNINRGSYLNKEQIILSKYFRSILCPVSFIKCLKRLDLNEWQAWHAILELYVWSWSLGDNKCCGSGSESGTTGSTCFWASWIRIWIH